MERKSAQVDRSVLQGHAIRVHTSEGAERNCTKYSGKVKSGRKGNSHLFSPDVAERCDFVLQCGENRHVTP